MLTTTQHEDLLKVISHLAIDVQDTYTIVEAIRATVPPDRQDGIIALIAEELGYGGSGYDDPIAWLDYLLYVIGYKHIRLIEYLRERAQQDDPRRDDEESLVSLVGWGYARNRPERRDRDLLERGSLSPENDPRLLINNPDLIRPVSED